MTKKTPASLVKEAIEKKEISVLAGARLLEISHTQMYDILNDKRLISLKIAKKIQTSFGISAKYLLQLQIDKIFKEDN